MEFTIPRYDMIKSLQASLQEDDWDIRLIRFYLDLDTFYTYHGSARFLQLFDIDNPDLEKQWIKHASYTITPKDQIKPLANQVVSKKLKQHDDILQNDYPFKYLIVNESALVVDYQYYPIAIYKHKNQDENTKIGYLKQLTDKEKHQIKETMNQIFVSLEDLEEEAFINSLLA